MTKHRKLPKRDVRRKLPPVSSGHSPILGHIQLSSEQLEELRRNGKTLVQIEVQESPHVTRVIPKVVTPANVKNGKVYFYVRSNGQIALRNFASDRKRHARHYAPPGKPFAGDARKRRRSRKKR